MSVCVQRQRLDDAPERIDNQVFDSARPHAVVAQNDLSLSYTYDLDGNLASETGPNGTRNFTFDSENRLTCVGLTPGDCSILRTDYSLDGSRIRDLYTDPTEGVIERFYAGRYTTYEQVGTDWRLIHHIYAFGQEFARKHEIHEGGQAAAGPIWRPSEPVVPLAVLALGSLGLGLLWRRGYSVAWAAQARERPLSAGVACGIAVMLVLPPVPLSAGGPQGVEERRWLVSDPIGSATVVVASDGTLERELTYTPFGGPDQQSGADPRDTSIYAGHRKEKATGLFYMQARWMNPDTGTFVSIDPVVDMRSPNRHNPYSYAANNPVNLTDPTGMVTPFMMGVFVTYGLGLGTNSWISFTSNLTIAGETYSSTDKMEISPAGVFWSSSGAGAAGSTGSGASVVSRSQSQGGMPTGKESIFDDPDWRSVALAENVGNTGPPPIANLPDITETAGRKIARGVAGSVVGRLLERAASGMQPGPVRGAVKIVAGAIRISGGWSLMRGGFMAFSYGNATVMSGNPFGLISTTLGGIAISYGGLEILDGMAVIGSGYGEIRGNP